MASVMVLYSASLRTLLSGMENPAWMKILLAFRGRTASTSALPARRPAARACSGKRRCTSPWAWTRPLRCCRIRRGRCSREWGCSRNSVSLVSSVPDDRPHPVAHEERGALALGERLRVGHVVAHQRIGLVVVVLDAACRTCPCSPGTADRPRCSRCRRSGFR